MELYSNMFPTFGFQNPNSFLVNFEMLVLGCIDAEKRRYSRSNVLLKKDRWNGCIWTIQPFHRSSGCFCAFRRTQLFERNTSRTRQKVLRDTMQHVAVSSACWLELMNGITKQRQISAIGPLWKNVHLRLLKMYSMLFDVNLMLQDRITHSLLFFLRLLLNDSDPDAVLWCARFAQSKT